MHNSIGKKVLVIIDSIDINDSSASKGRVALIKNLLKIGFELEVLHYTRKHISIEGAKCKSIKEQRISVYYLLSRGQRFFQRLTKINLAKYLEPIFGFSFTFFNDVNSIKKELKKIDLAKVDLVLTLSKASSFRPHYAVNKLNHFHDKWMAYVHDPYPFSLYPEPYKWKDPGYKKKELFFNQVSKNAKFSIFPSLLLKEWMGNHFPNFLNTGIVIPHQIFDLDVSETVLPDFFNPDKFNILHAGSLMKPRNPEGLLMGFSEFLKNNPKAKNNTCLLLVGDVSYHQALVENYRKNLKGSLIQKNKIDFDIAFKLQKEVAVNIILESKSDISPFLPGKFPHCISAKKPILVLGPKKSEVNRLLGENYEYWSEIDNHISIGDKIEKLYQDWLKNKNTFYSADLIEYMNEINLNKVFSKI